ncbi:MAG: DUF554 domain-containing protein [Spirochaetaceae bacterium]|jgi:uncharacterized membrane protein YqgA involved in biofilm formation|nr:DUF554 domain-containing protein [Spirochaetaceae bacterium]
MFGVVVNSAAIVVCSLLGSFGLRGLPARFECMLKKAIGLSVIYVGLKGAFENQHVLLLIMSMVAGAVIGELLDIDAFFARLGGWAERRLMPKNADASGSFARGFVQASVLFCSGSMAIVGSMQSGLLDSHETLLAKSVLDGSISIVFSASLGIGVAFSALSVFIYQGAIVALAALLRGALTQDVIREMSAAGSLVVAAIGFNFLGVQEIKVANLIPAVFIPALYLFVMG